MRSSFAVPLVAMALTAGGFLVSPVSAAAAPVLLADTQVGAQARPDLGFANLKPTAEIHVDDGPTAGPNNPGTPARPLNTIKAALAKVQPGQAVVVHTGRYKERLTTPRPGTASAPIWLVAAPDEKPVIYGEGESGGPFLRLNQRYWVVRGFEIAAGKSFAHAVRVQHTDHVLVDRVNAHSGTGPAAVAFTGAKQSALTNSQIWGYEWPGEESHGVLIVPGFDSVTNTQYDTDDILIRGNNSWGHSGDSVQCAGRAQTGTGTVDPTDITVEDNRYGNRHVGGALRPGDGENAVDIKSCQRITIQRNKLMGYRSKPTSPQGTALVAHFGADGVLMQHNRIWDSNSAASLGSATNSGLGSVVFRRNAVFDLVNAGSSKGAFGVRVGPARAAEIYHNTFYRLPVDAASDARNFAIALGDDGPVQRAVVINNIIDGAGAAVRRGSVSSLTVDKNLVWRTSRDVPAGSIAKDPQWRGNPVTDDFYTIDGSPARDVAVLTGAPFCGRGPDIGFLETCTP